MSYFPTNFIISPRNRFIHGTCIIVGIIFFGIYFWGILENSDDHRTLWVVDNSLSMTVSDIRSQSGAMISRLDLAKKIILESTKYITGDQAIMTVAQGARLELPLNRDTIAFANVIDGITPILRGGGSSLTTPLETIKLIYGSTPHLHINWITDGEFSDTGATLSGFISQPTITFIGVGTRKGGPILLGYNSDGRPRYKESSDGLPINSSRNDTVLASVSEKIDASVLLYDSDTLGNLDQIYLHQSGSSDSISWIMLLGICFIVTGLAFPRYLYHHNSSTGK